MIIRPIYILAFGFLNDSLLLMIVALTLFFHECKQK